MNISELCVTGIEIHEFNPSQQTFSNAARARRGESYKSSAETRKAVQKHFQSNNHLLLSQNLTVKAKRIKAKSCQQLEVKPDLFLKPCTKVFNIRPSRSSIEMDLNDKLNKPLNCTQELTNTINEPYDHPDGYRIYPNSSIDPRPTPHSNSGYSGPWIEGAFYDYFMTHKPLLDRIYIPVCWTDVQVAARGTDLHTSFLKDLDPNKKYFTIVQHCRGIYTENVPENVMIISSGAPADLAIPLLKNQPSEIIKKPKKIFCSFVGRFDTSQIRSQMKKSLFKMAKTGKVLLSSKNPNWESCMQASTLTLCPRGVGPTSFRLYESIACNSIPIYIWEHEKFLPYENELNWEKDLAIIINAKKLNRLPYILQNLSKAEIAHKQQMIQKYYKKYFTYDGCCQYICDKLKKDNTN